MTKLMNKFKSKGILEMKDKVMRCTRFIAKVLLPIILIVSVAWMSHSRINNINAPVEAYLSKEATYELITNPQVKQIRYWNKKVKIKDIKDLNKKFGHWSVLIYEDGNKPQNLVEIKNVNQNDKKEFMYVLPKDSEVLKIKNEGFKGFWWDLIIVSSVLLIIYFVFLYFVDKTIDAYNKIKNQLNEFKYVFEKYQNDNEILELETFKENYDAILKDVRSIKENNGYIGKIWWEFCETLMIKREDDVDNPNEYCENNPIEKLRNTDQIEVYINSEVIVDKQVQREVLDVIPGILTGLGLVGTFLAIAIALMGFDMSHIELSIQNLLGGLSIKFISSLAGITTSILFLYLKSHLFSKLESAISNEQLQLNSLFPRRTTESYLYYIWEEAKTSNERLVELENYAEERKKLSDSFIDEMGNKITEVLQSNAQNDIKEVLDDLSKKLSNSITGNLKDTLEKLIEVMEDVKATKAEQAQKITKSLINSNAMEEAGKAIAVGIDESVTKMTEQNAKVEDLVQAVGSYVNQLHDYESRVESNYKDLLESLHKALSTQTDFVGKNQDYVRALEDASNKISSTSSNLDNISARISEASEGFSQAAENVSGIAETSNDIVDNTRDLNNNLVHVLEDFHKGTQSSMEKLFEVFGESVSTVCGNVQRSVGELEEIDFEGLKDSIDTLIETIQDKHRN